MKVANITNIKLDSLLIVLINLSILIAVISIVALIKNRLNSSELHLQCLVLTVTEHPRETLYTSTYFHRLSN